MAAKKDSRGKATVKKAAGRKSECTDELWADFLKAVERGLSDSAAAREIGFPESTVRKWHTRIDICASYPQGRARIDIADENKKRDERRKEYTEACDVRLCVLEASILDDMNELDGAATDKDFASTRIQAIKVRIDTKKWLLSKLLRKKYGESQSVEMTGADGKDLIPAPGLPPEQMNELAVKIAEVREETRRKKMEAAGDE